MKFTKGDWVVFNPDYNEEALKISKATKVFNKPFKVHDIRNGYLYMENACHQLEEYFKYAHVTTDYEIY